MVKIKLSHNASKILRIFKKAGFEIYAVGGCIRNALLGQKTKDWDFTTNATPLQIQKLIPKSYYTNKFGTVGVPVESSSKGKKTTEIYEITTYRSESGYTDHRHPDRVDWGKNLEDDLKRRDFTVNAIAYDGKKITDLYKGQKDLNDKIIRAVGDPIKRFNEDALRMLRAVRFSSQFDFKIEKNTFNAIRNNALQISNISGERIRTELIKILSCDKPMEGITLLKESGLLKFILPEFENAFGVEQKSPKRHHIYDVGTHSLLALKFCPSKDPIVRLATLIHDIGKPVTYAKTKDGVITFYNHEIVGASIARNISDRLKFPKSEREKLIRLVRYHQFSVEEKQTDSAIRRIIRNIGPEYIYDMLDLRTGDRLGGGARETSWRLELFKKRLIEVQKKPFTVSDLKISGYDVMEIYKISPGPMIGKILNLVFEDVLSAKIPNEKKILIKRLKDLHSETLLNPKKN